jgi:enoyl-CoA hydratase
MSSLLSVGLGGIRWGRAGTAEGDGGATAAVGRRGWLGYGGPTNLTTYQKVGVMGISSSVDERGIAEVVMDNPPVNALTVAGWFDLARIVRSLGEQPEVRVVVLRAEGRGFNAGVDIKEMQQTDGYEALIGANRGCYEAFAAVYECKVPVIAAVNGFCVGGGIGLVGNADVIVASDDAVFGLPEVDRGALGAATHLSRLVPQHKMRQMVYTSVNATAQDLHAYGSVAEVVPQADLRDAALRIAEQIAAKSPTVIRAAKESLNGIDLWDVKRSYRFEQGFTFELNLSGVADEHRDAFVAKRETDVTK